MPDYTITFEVGGAATIYAETEQEARTEAERALYELREAAFSDLVEVEIDVADVIEAEVEVLR